jgi:tetratricopeptide (TPR) repeat protein
MWCSNEPGAAPLYAEQLAAMLREQSASEGPDAAVPATVQALIAARLDALPSEERTLLQDAAVVGKAFWPGVLAELSGRDRASVGSGLNEQVRRELVRASGSSSAAGEPEFTFWHALVRDVAYAELPEVVRMRKHRDTGAWLAARAAGDDLVGATAQHYVRAAELAEALGRADELASLEEPMREALERAGDRALRTFAASAAIEWYDRAIASAARAGLAELEARARLSRGEAFEQLGRFDEAEADYRATRRVASQVSDPRREARGSGALAHVLWLEDRFDERNILTDVGTRRVFNARFAAIRGRGRWAAEE